MKHREPVTFNDGDLAVIDDFDGIRPLDASYDMGVAKEVPIFNDDMKRVGSLACGTRVMVIQHPHAYARGDNRQSMFIQVLANGSTVWVRAAHLKRV